VSPKKKKKKKKFLEQRMAFEKIFKKGIKLFAKLQIFSHNVELNSLVLSLKMIIIYVKE
jgi:hypothetical protein